MKGKRIKWIDDMRGFCMLAIFWFHSEMYYFRHDCTPYGLYVGTALASFFAVSGFLMYKEGVETNVRERLYKVWRLLVVPYFAFCSVIVVGKSLLQHDVLSWSSLSSALFSLITGQASWFICALVVSQIMFVFAVRLSKGRDYLMLLFMLVLFLLANIIGNGGNASPFYNSRFNFWHVNEALLGCGLMIFGYLLHKNNNRLRKRPIVVFLLTAFLTFASKTFIIAEGVEVVFGPIITTNYPLFLADLLCSIVFLMFLFQLLPAVRGLGWIGRRSIVYYFACGGCPLVASKIARALFGNGSDSYFCFVGVFVLSVLLATVIAWIVYRFAPCLVSSKSKKSC